MLFLCIALLTAYPIFLGLQSSQSEILVPPDGEKISDNDSSSDNTSIPIEEALVKTLIVVNPNNISLVASESFTINIDIINVEDLSAYDLRLTYDDTIVTAIDVIIGDFFPKNCFVIKKEVTKNVPCSENIPTVWIAAGAPWGCPDFAVSGNGTLATIRFKVISTGNCTLKLYKTQILNSRTINYAAHRVIDGYVQCEIYEHEIAAYLDTPPHLLPGSSCLIEASAVNKGLCDETNVSFSLLIDGQVVNATIVDLLTTGSSIDLTYVFTPTEEKIYNVTAYVEPVRDEEYTQDNVVSENVVVRTKLRVPQDYATIQEAIDTAVAGETIVVAPGIYHEHIGIDKRLTLTGENCNTTIIDGNGENKVIITINVGNVKLSGFTIRNGAGGILLEYSNNSVIKGNIVTGTMDGISLIFSSNNTIISNMIKENRKGLFLGESINNTLYWNNFVNNTEQAATMNSLNIWENGVEGNYWSDYEGEDADGDGIGDDAYVIDAENRDNYPLIKQKTD